MRKFLLLLSLLLIGLSVLAGDLKEPEEVPILGEGGVLDRITNYLFAIFIIVATIFIIVAAFQFVIATGEPEKINKAKMSLLYALIGVLVAFSSKGLVEFIEKVVKPGQEIRTCADYCKVQDFGTEGNCLPQCGLLWGRHAPGGDDLCPPAKPPNPPNQCCCL